MTRVWIVNPFDPLPGDPEQAGRYASLARQLREAGHDVTWWTSSFSHRFKRPLDRAAIQSACDAEGIGVRFIDAPPYARNVSLARIRSHRVLAERFADAAGAESEAPRVVIASNPPPELTAAAARIAGARGAKLIVDTQDIWVENFRRLMPAALRWAWPLLLRPWIRANRFAYRAADAVVGVAGVYADEARRYGAAPARREVIPLGIDLAGFDAAARAGRCLLGEKPPGEVWAIYSGSLSKSYDVLTVAETARALLPTNPPLRFIFSGRGPLEDELRRRLADVPRVTFLGFAAFEDWAATLIRCDVGFCAIRPEALIAFPNKIFYYWAAGLAIVNSIPGECAEWVRRTHSGATYVAGDAAAARSALKELFFAPVRLDACRTASRRAAETLWDRGLLYRSYLKLVDELA